MNAKIAWASGTNGTILRTLDGGATWRRCSIPPAADKLDFRGTQAFNQNTAIVMSSGPGDQSKLYKTTDGCRTWRLVFANPDTPGGFFDAIQFVPGSRAGILIGDPVRGVFPIFRTSDGGESWTRAEEGLWRILAQSGESLFAASNSALMDMRGLPLFVTGGTVSRSHALRRRHMTDGSTGVGYIFGDLPMGHNESAGAFSVAARSGKDAAGDAGVQPGDLIVAVGGDYRRPDDVADNCATSTDGGQHWTVCEAPPHGYRSAVAYDALGKAWIAVGPNGTDVSSDDGRTWRRLHPGSGEPADADKYWNAVALPFAVGQHGRIGKLRPGAIAIGDSTGEEQTSRVFPSRNAGIN